MTPKQVALVQDSFAKVALTSAAVECARSRSSRYLQHPANLPLKQGAASEANGKDRYGFVCADNDHP
jgi:hypothetical protein